MPRARVPRAGATSTRRSWRELEAAIEQLVAPELAQQLSTLTRGALIAFERALERRLYDIDRADIHAHVGGSDDGFLYARWLIVAMGKRYYDAVRKRPSKASSDAEAESICYLTHRVFEERFDAEIPPSQISRESCSNSEGWPDGG